MTKCQRLRALAFLGWLGGVAAWSSSAHAICAVDRPTTAGGLFSDSYQGLFVESHDAARIRVHFVREGAASVWGAEVDGVPEFVSEVADASEAALSAFGEWGFRAVLPDADSCIQDGGDERIDIYLVDFGAGDGQAAPHDCAPNAAGWVCSGFILLDSRPFGYGTPRAAARVLAPHEIFHLVQWAYADDLPSWFAEGTAQWAAERLHPELTDFEDHLTSYYSEAHRSIDAPPGGAAGGFLYGTAIFALYLDLALQGPLTIERALVEFAVERDLWAGIEAAASPRFRDIGELYLDYASWVATTGERQGSSGFPQGAGYPSVDVTVLGRGQHELGVLSGFGLRAYVLQVSEPTEVWWSADPDRVRAQLISLPDRADLGDVTPPGMVMTSRQLLVVAGAAPNKTDAPFRFELLPALPVLVDAEVASGSAEPTTSGCSVAGDTGALGWCALLIVLMRRKRHATAR